MILELLALGILGTTAQADIRLSGSAPPDMTMHAMGYFSTRNTWVPGCNDGCDIFGCRSIDMKVEVDGVPEADGRYAIKLPTHAHLDADLLNVCGMSMAVLEFSVRANGIEGGFVLYPDMPPDMDGFGTDLADTHDLYCAKGCTVNAPGIPQPAESNSLPEWDVELFIPRFNGAHTYKQVVDFHPL